MAYFFIAVSTRENLDLCKAYAVAGFPGSSSGAWAYSEIQESDFVTFLYGARAHNLYQVVSKAAVSNPENLPPPWKPLEFESGIYHFPFRLHLKPLRTFEESIARMEFSYIAENLLQRGGYRKSHFQADATTLSSVSQMGVPSKDPPKRLDLKGAQTFTPRFVRTAKGDPPRVHRFNEFIVPSLIRQSLSKPALVKKFLGDIGQKELATVEVEVLGERALVEGLIDILLKEAHPKGKQRQVVIEVKTGKPTREDLGQLREYLNILGDDCLCGVMIAGGPPSRDVADNSKIHFYRYDCGVDLTKPHSFEELLNGFTLQPVDKPARLSTG